MQFQPLFVMRVYPHFFKILRPTPRIQGLMYNYLNRLTGKTLMKERGRWITKPDKLYGYRNKDRTEYRLHANSLPDFLKFMEQNFVTPNLYVTEHAPKASFHKVNLKVRPNWKPKDDQVDAINYITDLSLNDECPRKLLGLYTGAGKGFISMYSIAKLGIRTVVMVKPQYIEKWYKELRQILDLDLEDIMVVQGGDHLRGLIDLAQRNQLHAKFILLSNRTYQNYIKAFETDEDGPLFQGYDCHPDDFYDVLKASMLLIDEVHQEFHGNFKAFLYANIPLIISLSATLISHDPFMVKIFELAFPKKTRYEGMIMEKYIKMFPVSYRFKEPERIRTSEFGSPNYSHMAFEKSIMYRPWVLSGYQEMIRTIIDQGYIRDYMPGDKCLIFASSIKLCTELVRYLKQKFPNKIVKRYVEDDPLENIMTCDMGVSTILSAGTALDIPDLRMVLMTINIDSAQSNVQTRGRLRKLKNRDVKFYYTYCEQIQKHKDYHERRVALLKDTTLTIKDSPYTRLIG